MSQPLKSINTFSKLQNCFLCFTVFFVSLGLLLLLLAGAGCSASVSASADTCGTDTSVTCSGTDTGESCTGNATPDPSDDCVAATAPNTYCCSAGGTTVGIISNLPSSCSADSTVTCGDGADGYSCTSTDAPDDSDPTLECSIGVLDGANTDYCCLGSTYSWGASSCGQDDSVTCPTPGSFGFSCSGTDTPDMTDSTLTCTAGTSDPTDFCCASGIAGDGSSSGGGGITGLPSSCAADSSVTCTGGADGYSCTSTDAPDDSDPTLECSIGVADPTTATSTDYCCLPSTFSWGTSTCAQDDSVTGGCTTAGSYGFSCTGSDTPDQTDMTLTCSTGVADPDGNTDFCCQ